MYIKEDITISILRNNGFTVNSDLPTFVQEYLNSKYDFIAPPRVNSYYVSVLSEYDFASLMYIFNCLIYVENMEIDHNCFGLQNYDEKLKNKITCRVPQYDGNDVIFTKLLICPFFIKSPSFMINNIVHPETFDTKTVYLKLIYYFLKNTYVRHNLSIILPFGESIKAMFTEAVKQDIPFEKVVDKLILSQFPTFTDYMESIREYLKNFLPIRIEPSAIKNKKIDTDIVFKSSIFNGMKEGVKLNNNYENYDKSLTDKYNKYFTQALKEIEPILHNTLYAYPRTSDPLIYPYNDEIKHELVESLCRVVFNGEIYFQVLNRVMPDSFKELKESTTFMLDIAYRIKYSYYSLLKAFYFSYHMCFDNRYGELYYNKTPLIKPRGVVLKTDFTFSKIEGIYYPVWTLNQCNSIKNRETLISLILKTVWHNNKFIMRKVEAPVKNLLRERNNDMYIFKSLNSLYKQFTPKDTGFDKGQFRYNELLKTGLFDKVTKNKNPRDIKYLDFGGGIGDVGASIAKYVGFLKENSFVTDIQNWLGKEHTEEYAKNITYRYLKTNDLPFENNSIDFITCLQVLHHIPDKKYTLSQLYRILKPSGIILVREHNCETIQDQMLIDLEHSLHGFVVDEQGQDYLQNYNDTYMNKLDLRTMMIDSGFEEVTQNIVFPEDKGITKYYYSLWRKVNNDDKDAQKTPKNSKEINRFIQPVIFKKSWADYSDDED